jgi:hypothetical protein
MLIWRLENKKGDGPYTGGEWYRDKEFNSMWNRHCNDNQFPICRYEFPEIFKQGKHKVGCRSLETLNKWFLPNERRKLKEYGYELRVYSVPIQYTQSSKIQTIYEYEKAKRVI